MQVWLEICLYTSQVCLSLFLIYFYFFLLFFVLLFIFKAFEHVCVTCRSLIRLQRGLCYSVTSVFLFLEWNPSQISDIASNTTINSFSPWNVFIQQMDKNNMTFMPVSRSQSAAVQKWFKCIFGKCTLLSRGGSLSYVFVCFSFFFYGETAPEKLHVCHLSWNQKHFV